MLTLPRAHDAGDGAANGFFPGGDADYEKRFDVPLEWADHRITLEFEGVYRDARVFINNALAAHRPYGYSRFFVAADPYLRYGETNVIRVECSATEDTRWYSGLGIHRPVTLHRGELIHLTVEGPRFATPDIEDDLAAVHVDATVHNESTRTAHLDVRIEILDPDGDLVAEETMPLTVFAGERATVHRRVFVRDPKLWSPEHPDLYLGRVWLIHNDRVVDHSKDHFGIRRIQIDPAHGLRINGQPVKLRGACVHHDNGPLGAAAITRAEQRRVELLRAAGFNALRSAHQPMSKAMLRACDRLGMLVMDEAFDSWTVRKTRFDYSRDFPTWWRADIESMVTKDYNHPSVILYSIGNEIFETGNRLSARWGRELAATVKTLDPHRFTVNAINVLVSSLDQIAAAMSAAGACGGVNDMLGSMEEMVAMLWRSEDTAALTAEAFAQVDVAGYNYGDARYDLDPTQFPNRVCVGSETARQDIAARWQQTARLPHVIGDFCWTGWDYLGEAGIGRVREPGSAVEMSLDSALGDYPHLTSETGDLDMTGTRRPASYFREIVFGLRTEPYISVHPPQRFGIGAVPNAFAWDGSEGHWTWPADEGKPVRIDVYSDAEQVELRVNQQSLGRRSAGPEHGYIATFEATYAPGVLTATAYRDGVEAETTELHTAARVADLRLTAESTTATANDNDLVHVRIALVDQYGRTNPAETRTVRVDIEGPGVLAGLGSGDPRLDEPMLTTTRTTYAGTILAIVRPTGAGILTVRAGADDLEPRTVTIDVRGDQQPVC
ncbi:glycoside hydrolase family 2 TIM barrel-domain containing protein [Nocardia sp. NPDC059177]|uniref:glycoside hydrolase family 2 TIM barrel-domain containing protein n=1 Tax=Nocardia sp. NPDC059177 TaxID=3346759 RepID=UPI00367E7B5E